jgi:nucleoid-associated protein YgaU
MSAITSSMPGTTSANGSNPASGSNVAKAIIINTETKQHIPCMFNPKEYQYSKQNSWQRANTKGQNVPPMKFQNGQPSTLTMQLFFDTYAEKKDVRDAYTDAIMELMFVDESKRSHNDRKRSHPIVHFQWGKAWSFDAVITNLSQRFTLFLSDGTPVRATLDVTFQQVKDEKLHEKQNPTSGGISETRFWTVQPGDTLCWIAYKEYGNSGRWREIADANQLIQVRRLQVGSRLEIPHV